MLSSFTWKLWKKIPNYVTSSWIPKRTCMGERRNQPFLSINWVIMNVANRNLWREVIRVKMTYYKMTTKLFSHNLCFVKELRSEDPAISCPRW